MSVTRVADYAIAATLEQLDPELVTSGRLILIGLEAVRERLADKWERRKEQVWTHVEKLAARTLEPGDVVLRISEVGYAVAFATVTPLAARGQALQILGEILTHFLGSVTPDGLRISTVSSLDEGELRCEPVSQNEREAVEATELQPAETGPTAADESGRTIESWRLTRLRLSSGLEVGLSSWGEPLQHVRMDHSVGLRIARGIIHASGGPLSAHERDQLTPVSAAELDIATLEHVHECLRGWGDRAGFVLTPLSFRSIASTSARLRLLGAISGLAREDQARLIVELEDVDPGVPASRIVETVALVQPFTRGLVVRSSPARASLDRLKDARVLGVALDDASLDGRPGEIFGRLTLLHERSRGVVPDVFALGLPSSQSAALVSASGGGFYTVRPEFRAEALSATG